MARLNAKQRRESVKLVQNVCCNYHNGDCLLLDMRGCPQVMSGSVCCAYFRQAVLQDNAGESLRVEIACADTAKYCAVCGKAFQSKSNNAKYCGECAKRVKRKQNATGARMRRSNVVK